MNQEEFNCSMSSNVNEIAKALAEAQKVMTPVVKDATNPFFNSRYATLASCLQACRPLNEQGIAVLQPPASHGPDGICVTTLLIHTSGQWVRGELFMPVAKKDPQGFGSAISYARRYCLSSTVGLAVDDDDGNNGTGKSQGEDESLRRATNAIVNAPDKASLDAVKQRYSMPGAYSPAQVKTLDKAYDEKLKTFK